jgi:hypothetical protein
MPPLAAGAGPHLLLQTYLSRIASACPKAASNTVFMMAFYKRPPCRGSPPSVMRVSRQRSACLISTVLYQLAFRSLHLHSIPVAACPSSRTSSMLSANQARSFARQSQSAHVLRATSSVPGAPLCRVYSTSRLCRKLRIDGASRSGIASGDAVTQLASKGSSMADSSLELDAFDLHASRRLLLLRRRFQLGGLSSAMELCLRHSGRCPPARRIRPAVNDSTKGRCRAAGKQGLPAHGYGLLHCCSSAHCSRCRDLAQSPGRCLART